ncbi:septation protein SepH [Xylanimonas ulmi]|uniref:DUF3071 family protein n=1 Tax=Xylanimonas ulmi TaxID=228973 RepID=A0A4Q7M046_9MICO|nr:septation protein SepH [Xylanibacterium ulmi]RZS61096.1 DUF3071 family protein [Xylanibacterium ulmi]
MAELELVRVHTDGGHLVLRSADGTEHSLPVTDALRAALRDAARSGATPDAGLAPAATREQSPAAGLRPRELQARLRAGATAEELAAESGLPVEHVRRYEWPVLTEREHVIGMVRGHQVVGVAATSELGEIADSRLAARGVRAADAVWSARREGAAPWVVEVRFAAGDRERSARWTFDLRGRVVTPLDDEARWLGQPDDPVTPEVRGVPSLSARRGPRGDAARGSADRGASWAVDDETDVLLDDLAGRRGHRPPPRGRRPGTTSIPAVPAAAQNDGHDDGHDDGVDARVEGPRPDAPVRERGPAPTPEPVAEAGGTGASVVDLGRWNPRRGRDRSVSPGAGPGATQPALLPLPDSTAPNGDEAKGAGSAPQAEPQSAADRGGAGDHSGAHGEPAGREPGPGADDAPDADHVATASTPAASGAPATPGRGVPAARRSGRKGRAQVPSWDEIVFGARPDA